MENEFIAIGKAAKMLGVTTTTLRRWDKSGKFEPIRTPSGRRMYSISQIGEYSQSDIQNEISVTTDVKIKTPEYCQTCSTSITESDEDVIIEKTVKLEMKKENL